MTTETQPDVADRSTRYLQNDDYASSGKSKRGDSTGGQSRTFSQNDAYANLMG